MASRKSPSAPEWQVILEHIESQNRATIEAVQVSQTTMEGWIQDLREDLGGKIGTLESATRVMVDRLAGVKRQVHGLGDRMDTFETTVGGLELQIAAREEVLDRRLSSIETELARNDRECRGRDAGLELGIRELRVSVLEISAQLHELRTEVHQNSADIRSLSARLDALARLEERVAALEKRAG